MAEINQFGSAKPVRSGEGTSCAECSQMLADAKRGASLLEMLKSPRPEPSSLLLDRIIAQTGGQISGFAGPVKSPAPASVITAAATTDDATLDIQAVIPVPAAPTNVIPFRPRTGSRFSLKAITHTMMQPRLAMTAAMAFFSITLTLNLTGVHLTDLRASDLTPSSLKHSFFHANASVVRYYENLRVVYELESRLNEFKRTSDSDNPPATKPASKDDDKTPDSAPSNSDKPRKAPKSGSGTSERRNPLGQEFKLAGYDRTPFLPEATFLNTAPAVRSNKLKETSQEGDLV